MFLSRRRFLQGLVGAAQLRPALQEMAGQRDAVPVFKRVVVPIRGLDRRLDGMRIGQLSDVHVGAVLWLDYLERSVALFSRSPPELLAITGDLLDEPDATEAVLDILSSVRAPFGRFYVLGNHENFRDRSAIIRAARAHSGVQLLINQSQHVEVQGARVHVSGVDFPVGQRATSPRQPINSRYVREATEHAQDADFRLCLAHHPDDFDEIRSHSVELTLAGHTHGGQLAPLGVWLAQRMFRYPCGPYMVDGRHLYVSAGTGGSLPVRVGVDAEVTELTLRRV